METDSRSSRAELSTDKVLIIDDDDIQLRMLEKILVGEGYDVITFNNGGEALEAAFQHPPDMVLSDLLMPNLDGFEVIRRLKADQRTRSIPIILITAFDDRSSESKGLALGAVDYIVKPLVAPIVKARVHTHMELKRHRDDLEQLVRRRSEELIHSRQQFQDLVEKSLVGIAIFQDEEVVYQNPELERVLPDLTDKIRDKHFSFVHPEDLIKITQAYKSLRKEGTTHVEADIRLIDINQAEAAQTATWINCRGAFFNYQGRPAILVNVVDITHTKDLERLLLMRNKMASLGRIASGMAHEIRNPLTGITSYLYTLEQLCANDTFQAKDMALMREITTQLKLATHKIDAVIKRVLDFARPTIPKLAPIDINQCLDNVIKLTAVTLRKAGIKVTHELNTDIPECYSDMGLLEQVLLNLIHNAANAVRKTDRDKHIHIHSFYSEGEVCIRIDDSGPGVAAGLREKIFDPFFTTSPDGSGIGLSIAHRIVSDHNGDLSVGDCELGGARFQITIPIEKRKNRR